MDEIFRAYNAPLIIDAATGFTAERWEGLKAWSGTADRAQIPTLVEAAYGVGRPPETLVVALQDKDSSLTFGDGATSSRQLGAAGLDYLFSHNDDLDVLAALATATAGFGGRTPNVGVDIAGRAQAELETLADYRRSRASLGDAIAAVVGDTPSSKTIAGLAESFDAGTTSAALTDVLKAVGRSLDKVATSTRRAFTLVQGRLDQADEESDVLWYVFGGVSSLTGNAFKDMDAVHATLLAGIELAGLTREPLHARTFGAMLTRLGIASDPVTVQTAIEATPTAAWTGLTLSATSARLTPLHRLAGRHAEFGTNGDGWIAGVETQFGFAPTLEVGAHDLALQAYRERLLIKGLAA